MEESWSNKENRSRKSLKKNKDGQEYNSFRRFQDTPSDIIKLDKPGSV